MKLIHGSIYEVKVLKNLVNIKGKYKVRCNNIYKNRLFNCIEMKTIMIKILRNIDIEVQKYINLILTTE